MGAAASTSSSATLAPASSATLRLHRALDAWDEAAMAKALSAGADPACFTPVDPLEQYLVFAPDVQRKGSFALTSLGRLASNLLSHMVAQETGLGLCKIDRETGPRVLALLLAPRPAQQQRVDPPVPLVLLPLHTRRPSPTATAAAAPLWAPGPSSLLDALRLIVCASKGNEQLRRARANFLLPTLLATVAALPSPTLPARDFLFWTGLLELEFLAPLLQPGAPPLAILCPAGDLQPPLIAAVDAGSAQAVKLLLEARVHPNASRSNPNPAGLGGGMSALHRVPGDWAFALPAPDAFPTPSLPIVAAGAAAAAAAAAAGAAGQAPATGAAATGASEEEGEQATAYRPCKAMLEALLHAGADVQATESASGSTALHFLAASNSLSLREDPAGRLALAHRLVLSGCSPAARDAGGRTAGEVARAARPDSGARFALGLEEAAAAAARRA
jgi:hypothetical protein